MCRSGSTCSIRFGKWHEIVAQDLPADRDLYCNTTAMIHYAKGVAHAALGDVPAAEAEQALFREAAKRVPKSRYLHNVPCVQLLAVAEEMLAGEIAYRRGEHDAAFAHLRAAIALEDDLPYDEPWGWMQPVRHALGALLLEQGRAAEAEDGLSRGSRPRRRACRARRSIRTTCGPCAGCWTASSGAARLRRPR